MLDADVDQNLRSKYLVVRCMGNSRCDVRGPLSRKLGTLLPVL